MFRLFKKYLRINRLKRNTLNQIIFWLLYATILVRLVPLRWFDSLLGEYRKESSIKLNSDEIELVKLVQMDLRRWKRVLPWKVKCFEESITVKKVLQKHKINSTLYLGVNKKNENELKAHAWLKCGGKFITGQKGHENFSVVGFYS